MTKKEKTENAIAIPVQNARMANVYTEANAAKSMLSTNSKIALLARATSAKHSNSSKTERDIADVWKRVGAKNNNKNYQKDDSFSRHFSTYCSDCTNSNQVRTKLKGILDVNILWQGERIQCMKTARTRDCRICMKERMTIMQSLRDDK